MNNSIVEQLYEDVQPAQTERLRQFRLTHPFTSIDIEGETWNYIACGVGNKVLVVLPGEERKGDMAFSSILAWEQEYRIIYPSYPAVSTIEALVNGLADLLQKEHIDSIYLLGIGFGGNVAQCFIRKYPQMVEKLVLQNTSVPQSDMVSAVMVLQKGISLQSKGIVRKITKQMLNNLIIVPPEEKSFWQAYASELATYHLTKPDLLALFGGTVDYRRTYHFTPDDLREWPGDVLVIESDDDRPITRSMRKAIKATYPQAQLHTFNQGGHTPFLSQTKEYLSIVNGFLVQSPTNGAMKEHE